MPPGNDWTKSTWLIRPPATKAVESGAHVFLFHHQQSDCARGSLRLAKPDRARAFCPLSPGLPRPGIIISYYGATPLRLPHSVRKHLSV